MTPSGLTWKLFLGNTLLVLAAIGVASWFIFLEAAEGRVAELRRNLSDQAQLAARAAADFWPDEQRLSALLDSLPSGVHAAILDSSGATTGGRLPALRAGEVMLTPEQRAAALQGDRELLFERTSADGRLLQCAAALVRSATREPGVLVVAAPSWVLASDASALRRMLLVVVLVALLATLLLRLGLERLWTRPLEEIINTARSLSRGDLSARVEIDSADEMGVLGRSLNRMRDRMVRNYQTIDRQRRTLEALLTQLREGVVVADAAGRILLINPAAVRLLNLPPEPRIEALIGQAVERCIPQHDLQCMLYDPDSSLLEGSDTSFHSGAPQREERLQVESERGVTHLLAHATRLVLPQPPDGDHRSSIGRLLVLTDITDLTRTIQVKADFVANASHELRTPLSTMRVALESLERVDLAEDEAAARRFLTMIERQRARLEALASDLLDLARLESPSTRFKPAALDLPLLLSELREQFSERAQRKGLSIETDLANLGERRVSANPHLLRLILDNLVDNAVKFTERGGLVRISAWREEGSVAIQVSDTGCGIMPEDQERVFERFFQVERARAGPERGTGLGLSIVRHAAAAMNAEVDLFSAPGEGTQVTVSVPQGVVASPLASAAAHAAVGQREGRG